MRRIKHTPEPMKWYARTCSLDSDGGIEGEVLAPTAHILAQKVRAEPPNHWAVFINRSDGEGNVYKETWTTLWDVPGVIFCTHSVDKKALQPRIPKGELE